MRLYNYTNIKHREKRLYSIFDTTISKTGIMMGSLYTALILLLPFTIVGVLFCIKTGYLWYNPVYLFDNTQGVLVFYMVTIAFPIGLGFFLNSYKIQNLKAIDYLKMVMAPKTPKSSDGSKISETRYKIDALVEKVDS